VQLYVWAGGIGNERDGVKRRKAVSWLWFWASFRRCFCRRRRRQSNYVGVVHCLVPPSPPLSFATVNWVMAKTAATAKATAIATATAYGSWLTNSSSGNYNSNNKLTKKSRLPNSRVQVEWLNFSIRQLTCLRLRRRC